MVEGAPLLREYTRKGIEGSNPFLSATLFGVSNAEFPKLLIDRHILRRAAQIKGRSQCQTLEMYRSTYRREYHLKTRK